MNLSQRLALSGATALLSLAAASTANAQNTAPAVIQAEGLEEIVVTTRKLSEKLMDVPISIAAFSAEDIKERGIQNLDDVARATPGLTFSNMMGSMFPSPVIRGFAPVDIRGENNTAIFVDGVYISGKYGMNFSQLDIERIEVVKGPQAALYGRNAFSGAINYITAKPTDTFQGSTEVQAGSHGKALAQLSISGPLVPGVLRGRISLGYDTFDGSYENQYSGLGEGANIGGYTNETVSSSLLWTPTDKFEAELGLYYSDDSVDNPAIFPITANCEDLNSQLTTPTTRVAYGNYCGTLPSPGRKGLTTGPQATGEERDVTRGHLSLKWDTDYGTVSSLTGYSEANRPTYYFDGNRNTGGDVYSYIAAPTVPVLGGAFQGGQLKRFAAPFLFKGAGDFTDEWSEELRFASDPQKNLRYSFGVNYYETHLDNGTDGTFALVPLPSDLATLCYSCAPAGGTGLYYDPTTAFSGPGGLGAAVFGNYFNGNGGSFNAVQRISYDTKAPSVFGSMDYSFTEQLTGRVEGRYTDEKRSVDHDAYALAQEQSFKIKNYNATLNYKPLPNWMVYGSYGHAEKSGGFDIKTVQFTAGVNTGVAVDFDVEKSDGFELGFKSRLWDNRLSLEASVYRYDWTDIVIPQILTAVQNPGTGTLAPIVVPVAFNSNGGDATNQGIEISVTAQLAEHLSGNLSGSYIDATYDDAVIISFKDFPSYSPTGDVSGNEMLRTSKYQYSAGLAWKAPLYNDIDWSLRGDLASRYKQYADTTNQTYTPTLTTLNMAIGLNGEKWVAELWGHNLTNEDGAGSAQRDVYFSNSLPDGTTFGTPPGTTPAGGTGKNTSYAWRYSGAYLPLREYGLTLRYKF
ncbi:MAG: TonB-dependent receptor [Planctomycetes bacterium]|nr:TonB-dependent receptor [Planctomycetota bacterium]